MAKISNSEWFTPIGGWLVTWEEDGKKKQKQFGGCTSFNLFLLAFKNAQDGVAPEPESYKLLPEVIKFLQSLKNAKLAMFQTLTDGCNFESGFVDFAIIKDGEITMNLSSKSYKKSFIKAMTEEVKKYENQPNS